MKKLVALFAVSIFALTACETGSDSTGGGGDVVKKDCTLPWGGLLKHGEVVGAFKDAEVMKPSACVSEQRTCNDGSLSGSFTHKGCVEKEEAQNPNQEKPVAVDAEGKKWGSIKEVSKVSLWKPDSWHGERPACPAGAAAGKSCDPQALQGCKTADGQKLICTTDTAYKVWGWIYEKEGLELKPLQGVKVDHFWFAGCMVGFCNSVAGPVETDKDGYFEYMTSSLNDTIRILGKEGYFGICQGANKPIQGGGTAQLGLGKPTLGGVQYKLKADSCANGFPQ